MTQRNSTNFALFSLGADILLTIVSLILSMRFRTASWLPFASMETVAVPRWLFILIPILWSVIFVLHSVYDPKKTLRIVNELATLMFASASAALILAGLLYVFERAVSRGLFVTFVLLNIFLLVVWRICLRLFMRFNRWPFARPNTIIIGAGDVGQKLASFVSEHAAGRINFVGYVDDFVTDSIDGHRVLGTINQLNDVVQSHEINDVIIALPLRAYERVQSISLALRNSATHIHVIPDYFNLTLYRATVQEYGGIPLINLREPALNGVQRMTKRIFDVLISSALLLLFSPIMLMVALAIRLDSNGGILFKQLRIGENGQSFKMYKFRSMVANAPKLPEQPSLNEAGAPVAHKIENDPRVTRVGRFIRRTSLDELPQFLNVLKGDMSLVGPRPELPWLVENYEPWQRVRFAVPQGITGWWQINGRSDKPLHLNTSEDLYYIQNYSIWMDFLILLKTPLVVLRGKGAY